MKNSKDLVKVKRGRKGIEIVRVGEMRVKSSEEEKEKEKEREREKESVREIDRQREG